MTKNWTVGLRRWKEAVGANLYLRMAFMAYSFLSLMLLSPAPALGSVVSSHAATIVRGNPVHPEAPQLESGNATHDEMLHVACDRFTDGLDQAPPAALPHALCLNSPPAGSYPTR